MKKELILSDISGEYTILLAKEKSKTLELVINIPNAARRLLGSSKYRVICRRNASRIYKFEIPSLYSAIEAYNDPEEWEETTQMLALEMLVPEEKGTQESAKRERKHKLI